MRNGRFWTILGLAMCLLFGTAGAVLAAGDLSAEHNLTYTLADGGYGDQFAITAEGGKVQLTVPFISGGCIAINELKILSITAGDDGLRTVNGGIGLVETQLGGGSRPVRQAAVNAPRPRHGGQVHRHARADPRQALP